MKRNTLQKLTAFLLAALLVCTGIPFAAAEDESLPETAFDVEYLPGVTQTPQAGTTGVVIKGLKDGFSVKDLVIPETIGGYPVTAIRGIKDVTALETVRIPSGVTEVDSTFSFANCPNLRAFTVAAGNTTFTARDGVLMQGTKLHTYPVGKTNTTYTLPADCTELLRSAFCGNPYLQTLTVPVNASVLHWDADAVDACPALREIVILTTNLIAEHMMVADCPQDIRLHLAQGVELPYHKTTHFENCGEVTICTAYEVDDYYRTFAPLMGYGYTVCGDAHEPLAADPDTPVTVEGQAGLSYHLLYETVEGQQVVTGVSVDGWNSTVNAAYDLVVPETIDGYPVTEVDVSSDFRICSLTLPKTVKRLYATYCTLLQRVDVNEDNETFLSIDGVVYTKDGKQLVLYPAAHPETAYRILEGTEKIKYGAFNSTHIQSLYLPASLTEIDGYLTTGRAFASFTADENNPVYSTQDGVLYNKDKTVLLQYPCGKTGDTFTVPASVRLIETGAFYNNFCLSRLAFADGVDSTPVWDMKANHYTTSQQSGITRVHIPSSVQTVNISRFDTIWAAVCTDALPSAAGNFAAQNSIDLYLCHADHTSEAKIAANDPRLNPSDEIGFACESVCADDSGEVIGLRVVAFTNLPESGLYSVDIPETIGGLPVLELKPENSKSWRNLRGVAIPKTVRYIAPFAFLYSYNLSSIVVDPDNPDYRDIDGVLFTADGKELVIYPAARVAYNYSVPEGTQRITSTYAFAFCRGVTTLHLPASLTTLPTDPDGTYNFMRLDNRIQKIIADSANPAFCTDSQDALYTKDMHTLIRCCVHNAGQNSFTVPAGVTRIEDCAFNRTYSPSDVRQGWYIPSPTQLRVLIFADGTTAVPSFRNPTRPGTITRTILTLHIPSSVTQIGDLGTVSGFLICSDRADSYAARYAQQNRILFAVCEDDVHDWFALRLTDNVGTPSKTYIAARIGQPLGTLPTRTSPDFLGWYAGDERVTEDTIVTGYEMTLTAGWKDAQTPDDPDDPPADAEFRLDPPVKLTYHEGESFDPTGMALYCRTDGGAWELLATDGFTWVPEVFSFAGVQTMSVEYGGIYWGTLRVTVLENEVEYRLEPPTKMTYDVGDTFDPSGMKLYRRVNGGEWTLWATSGFQCSPAEFSEGGLTTVTVTFNDFIGTVQVDVHDVEYEYRLEPPLRLTYPVGASFEPSGMRILRRQSGGEWEVYEESHFNFTPSVFTKTGSQYVKVTCGSFSENVRVEVSEAGVEYTLMPPLKSTYAVGDTFDPLGLRLLQRENGGEWELVAEEGFTCTPAVLNEVGTCSVTVRYGGTQFRGTVKVTVEEKVYEYRLDPPTKTTYRVGEALDPAGLRIMRRADGGEWEVFADSGIGCAPTVFWQAGTADVIVTYGSFYGVFQVTVDAAEYVYRLTPPTKTAYRVGESFDPTGMQLLRRVNGGEWTVFTESGFICTPSVLTEAGEQEVTVQYGSFTGTVHVTVQPAETPPANTPQFTLTGGTAAAGETVQVSVCITDNPGIAAARLSLSYDRNVLTLESVQNGEIFGASAFTRGGNLSAVPYTVLWEDSLNPDHTDDGTLVTYTFRVKDDAEEGTTTVTLTYDANSTYNANLDNVTFAVQNGAVTVQNRLPGDANGDGSVDLKDAATLRRFLAGGWNVTVTEKNADVNGDGEITLKDVAYITRFLAGGWGITLV